MTDEPPYYRIYLLTVWQERQQGPPAQVTWRFRLEDPRTGRQRAFADAATLMNVLLAFTLEDTAANQEGELE
ncbi:MAG: hypothetical protein KDE19_15120 [Caldilineaceae bacterium]|nr:hypothetical protein [Caldilineaceae bacterium]